MMEPAKTEARNGPVIHFQTSGIEATSNRSFLMLGAVSFARANKRK